MPEQIEKTQTMLRDFLKNTHASSASRSKGKDGIYVWAEGVMASPWPEYFTLTTGIDTLSFFRGENQCAVTRCFPVNIALPHLLQPILESEYFQY